MLSTHYNHKEVENGKYENWKNKGYFLSGDLTKTKLTAFYSSLYESGNSDVAILIDVSNNMKGGKLVSSDGAVRVASSSSESYSDVSANFNMTGGEIEGAEAVRKSFPEYFELMKSLGADFTVSD